MVSIEEQLEYICNLEYKDIESQEDYDKLKKNIKALYLDFNVINCNKLPNTLINLSYFDEHEYGLNNLPLNLKYLLYDTDNCNLPPNIIYLECYLIDVYNLPRSLNFIIIYNKYSTYYNENKIQEELYDHHYNKNNINFINYYQDIIKLKSIY